MERMRKFELCDYNTISTGRKLSFANVVREVYTLKIDDKIIEKDKSFDTCFRRVLREGKDDDIYHETYHDEHEPQTVKSLRESDYVTK